MMVPDYEVTPSTNKLLIDGVEKNIDELWKKYDTLAKRLELMNTDQTLLKKELESIVHDLNGLGVRISTEITGVATRLSTEHEAWLKSVEAQKIEQKENVLELRSSFKEALTETLEPMRLELASLNKRDDELDSKLEITNTAFATLSGQIRIASFLLGAGAIALLGLLIEGVISNG